MVVFLLLSQLRRVLFTSALYPSSLPGFNQIRKLDSAGFGSQMNTLCWRHQYIFICLTLNPFIIIIIVLCGDAFRYCNSLFIHLCTHLQPQVMNLRWKWRSTEKELNVSRRRKNKTKRKTNYIKYRAQTPNPHRRPKLVWSTVVIHTSHSQLLSYKHK